jgi:hypothetical protein
LDADALAGRDSREEPLLGTAVGLGVVLRDSPERAPVDGNHQELVGKEAGGFVAPAAPPRC